MEVDVGELGEVHVRALAIIQVALIDFLAGRVDQPVEKDDRADLQLGEIFGRDRCLQPDGL